MKRLTLALTFFLGFWFSFRQPAAAAGGDPVLSMPDFTKGDPIPANATHDWNLGATGARGWMFSDKLVTSDARQIAITRVHPGSPADGILAAGDVILGVAGKPFSSDPRTELGKALTAAESETGAGNLTLTCWRNGTATDVTLKLPVLGDYSATAPYDCPKSKRILELGIAALAGRLADPGYAGKQNPITRSLNALALLAYGDPAHLKLIRREAEWAAAFSSDNFQSWHYGYVMIMVSEYIISTRDPSAVPGLRRLALEVAKGQSAVGSWGHTFALPDGRLRGYGMMNSPGLPLTIALVMARNAGVSDPAIDQAIERSARLLRFYIGKGAIPYGDHQPWIETHEDNGKCGMAAVLFNLLGEKSGAEFFTRMSLASHGPERDCGHTGNLFNLLWSLPAIAQAGPQATGAWMREFGTWYFDLARQWDGNFVHQGPPEPKPDSYSGWDCTGLYLLAHAVPLGKIHLTGRKAPVTTRLDAATAESIIRDGRGWSNKDRHSAYDSLTPDQLLAALASWSPVVRERAAMAISRRPEFPVPALIRMLETGGPDARYGACQALAALRGKAAPAHEALARSLDHPDLWLRIKAADALAAMGAPAMPSVPALLKLLARTDPENDPRGMQQRYLCFVLFDPRDGLLGRSLDGVDRKSLAEAIRAGLRNQDGRARGSIGSVYQKLSFDDIRPLLPSIYQAVAEPAPSGEMFADSIRVEGLRLLAKHRIREGIAACVHYARHQNPWASEKRTPELMEILLTYGAHAKAVIPELTKLAHYFETEEQDFPKPLMIRKAGQVRDAIKAIESSTELPELISIHRGH